MKLLNYWPIALLLLVPVIILFYLLKQRAVEHPYSSIYLWKELYQNRRSDTPWEKLKKNILMILQILTLLVLIFALCSPYLLKGGTGAKNVILVFDTSGSMNMEYENGKSRLDVAKEQAISYLQEQGSDTAITLIVSGDDEALLLQSNVKDKSKAISKIKSLEAACTAGSLDTAIDMVRTLQGQFDDGSEAVFYTDSYVSLNGITGYEVNLYLPADNACVSNIMCDSKEDGITVMAEITNEYSSELKTDLNLYGDDKLLEVRSVTIPAGESQTVYFEHIDYDGTCFSVEINESDALNYDNVGYGVIEGEGHSADVLLVTEQNLYLEKAINVNPAVNLVKISDVKDLAVNEKDAYDLYVFDCQTPDHLPENASILLVGAPYDELYESIPLSGGMTVSAQKDTVTRYIEDLSFGVAAGYRLTVPAFGESFLETAEGSIAFIGEQDNRTIAVLGFDVHDSQLPLMTEFPILIQNILGACISTGMCNDTEIDCGEIMKISSDSSGEAVEVKDPTGEVYTLSVGNASYTDTDIPGFYTVSQKTDGETIKEAFAANFPIAESGTSYTEPGDTGDDTKVVSEVSTSLNLRNYIIALALLLLCVEWLIYVKQN